MSLEMLEQKVETSPAYLLRLEKGTAANPGRNFSIRLVIALYRDDIDVWISCSRPRVTCL